MGILIVAGLMLTVYMYWCGTLLVTLKRQKTLSLKIKYAAITFALSFCMAAFFVIFIDMFVMKGREGAIHEKVTVINEPQDSDYGDKSSSQNPDGSLEVTVLKPELVRTRFKDVAGQEEAKAEVVEVVDFLKNPEKYKKLGASIPKGLMLYGPPGTGKTLLARAVAGESDVTFIAVNGAAFDEMYVGVGAARIRELFKIARANQPCIVFIDEIDALAPPRSDPNSLSGGRMQTINQLLSEMDNVLEDANQGIIIMGATNRLEGIDSALLRPGRFDRKVFIRLPNIKERLAILKLYLKNIQGDNSIKPDSIAGTTYGFSGADLKNLVNEAAIHAARMEQNRVTQDNFEHAIDKIKLGLEIESALVPEVEKQITAYHEAGHTIVGIFSPNYDMKFNKVTVGVRDATLGVTKFEAIDDNFSASRAYIEDNLAMLMAGRIAEEMLVGKEHVTTGASNDLKVATEMAERMVMGWGVSDISEYISFAALDKPPTEKINEEVERILSRSYEKARKILTDKKDLLIKLAKALEQKETLDRTEVLSILGLSGEVVKPVPLNPGLE